MLGVLADLNCSGQLRVLLGQFHQDSRRELWTHLNLTVPTFPELGLPPDASDLVIWQSCQREQLVLITCNRNQKGDDSLEAVMRLHNTPQSLPVFTLANPDRLLADSTYAGWVADRFLEYLFDIDKYRGAGRLYLP